MANLGSRIRASCVDKASCVSRLYYGFTLCVTRVFFPLDGMMGEVGGWDDGVVGTSSESDYGIEPKKFLSLRSHKRMLSSMTI